MNRVWDIHMQRIVCQHLECNHVAANIVSPGLLKRFSHLSSLVFAQAVIDFNGDRGLFTVRRAHRDGEFSRKLAIPIG